MATASTEGKDFAGWSADGREPDPVADDLRAQAEGLTRGDSRGGENDARGVARDAKSMRYV